MAGAGDDAQARVRDRVGKRGRRGLRDNVVSIAAEDDRGGADLAGLAAVLVYRATATVLPAAAGALSLGRLRLSTARVSPVGSSTP